MNPVAMAAAAQRAISSASNTSPGVGGCAQHSEQSVNVRVYAADGEVLRSHHASRHRPIFLTHAEKHNSAA
jgi:hypothetical protein